MRGSLEERGSGLAFRHDLIRRAVVQSHFQAVRSALHEQIGISLAEAGAPVERVAEHVLEAGPPSRRDVAWLRASLDPLLVRAPALTVELLRRATATVGDDFRDLDVEVARALLWAGLPAEAEHAPTVAGRRGGRAVSDALGDEDAVTRPSTEVPSPCRPAQITAPAGHGRG